MTSSFTPNKNLELPAHNDYVDDWDVPNNADFTAIDTALGGHTNLNATSLSGVVTLTSTQYTPPIILITGTLSADVNYQLPSGVGGVWSIFNNTTGAHNVTFSSAGGGSVEVLLQGYTTSCISDGTNVGLDHTAPTNPGGLTTQVQYNNGGVISGSSKMTFDGTYLSAAGLKLLGSSTGFVGLQSPSTGGSTIYTFPAADGTAGQVLSTNGSAVLSWATASGGGGGGVSSFNGRVGAVTLLSSDVTGALGYTPTNSAGNITGSAASLTTARTISITGDLTYTSAAFNGSANVSGVGTLASVNSNVGTFGNSANVAQVTVNAKGLVTAVSNVAIAPGSPYNANSLGYLGIPQSAKSGNYTLTLADMGTELFFTAGNGIIPANASVAAQIGSFAVFTFNSGLTGTVSINSDTLRYPIGNVTGTRTVTGPGFLVARKEKSTEWWVVGGVNIS